MEFKIDTKPNYTIILPESADLDEIMADMLRQKVKSLTLSGSHNFIVNLSAIQECAISAGDTLLELHRNIYNEGGSLVFANLQEPVLQSMKKEQLHLSLNLAPTLIEAIDMINMEILERDLLKES